MTSRAVVVGLGGDAGGDDAIGLDVARAFASRFPAIDVVLARDAMVLVDLLVERDRVVLVDAVIDAGAAGRVFVIEPARLGATIAPVSSHATSVARAVELACVLHGDDVVERLVIVAVAIAPPTRASIDLSDTARASIDPAIELVARAAASR